MGTSSALSSLLGSSGSIDLSSILEALNGSSTPGIDVNSAVSAAVSAAEAPEDYWEGEETTLQNQTSALNQIETDASNLDSDMRLLNSLTGPLSAATVTSSDSSVVTASAAPGTAASNISVEVNSLAASDTWSSSVFSSSTTALPAGTVTITPPGGSATTITIGSGVNTLSDLANAINSDNLGVTASVITDANGARLAVVSNTSGQAASFTISSSDPTNLGFTEVVQGANASLTVNGISLASASNTVTGVVPGVTLNLLNADPGVQQSLSVSPDTAQVSSAINQFVSDYNTLIQAVNSQYSDSGSGQGVLATDPTLRNLQTALLQAIDYTSTSSSGSPTTASLASLGITVSDNGTLSVDSSTLTSALQNNFSEVQNFFQGSALNGFANSLDQQLTSFIDPGDGAFTVDLQSISSELTGYQNDVTNFQTDVIAPLQTQLQSEYSKAEIALQELPSELKDIDAELGLNNNSSSS
jgi:flagellar hook-associated protein 2